MPEVEYLMSLEIEQLTKVRDWLQAIAKDRKRRRGSAILPPSPPNNLNTLADTAGLDITHLQREINRYRHGKS